MKNLIKPNFINKDFDNTHFLFYFELKKCTCVWFFLKTFFLIIIVSIGDFMRPPPLVVVVYHFGNLLVDSSFFHASKIKIFFSIKKLNYL